MKSEWNETSPSHIKKEAGKTGFFTSFSSRRSRQVQIFHFILISGFISPVAEASLGDFDLSGIFGDATVTDCGITEFNEFRVFGLCGNSPGCWQAT